MESPSADQLEIFSNQYSGREYLIEIICPEFTSMCPKTGQPDFGTITIQYIPLKTCIELKSLKLYLQKYRNQGVFYESLVNQIMDDFIRACAPIYCKVIGQFTPRGGITSRILCEHGKRPE